MEIGTFYISTFYFCSLIKNVEITVVSPITVTAAPTTSSAVSAVSDGILAATVAVVAVFAT
jgi:hypothetical protein